ncbi:MAG: stage II sporulation protein P [Oscillospiraceae bacterium]
MKRQAVKTIKNIALSAVLAAVPFFAAHTFGQKVDLSRALDGVTKVSASFVMPNGGLAAAQASLDTEHEVVTVPENPLADANEQTEEKSEELLPNNADIEQAETMIAQENRKPIEEVQFATSSSKPNFWSFGSGFVQNATKHKNEYLSKAVAGDTGYKVDLNSNDPQVLIIHTHTTESYDRYDCGFYDVTYPTRSTDPQKNIIAVGEVLGQQLNANGIKTIHALEYHDYPSYTNSYYRSEETVKGYLAKYPSIKIVLDLHRDGMQRADGTRVKPTVVIDGKKAAQFMIICCADDETGFMPNYLENLKLAVRIQNDAATMYPGIARPVLFDYRDYNQYLSKGALLIEIGSEANTLDEAKCTAELLGEILSKTLSALPQ